ncbi:MAG: hypothetical protein U0P48_08220 [Ancrocorticia sp.]
MNLDAELAFDHAWERIEDLHHRQILTDHDLDVLVPKVMAATGAKIAVIKVANRLDKRFETSDV